MKTFLEVLQYTILPFKKTHVGLVLWSYPDFLFHSFTYSANIDVALNLCKAVIVDETMHMAKAKSPLFRCLQSHPRRQDLSK